MPYTKNNIVDNMTKLEMSWRKFLSKRYSDDLQLLRWGQSHRVYKSKDKVFKIEKINDEKNPSNLGLSYENSVLNLLNNTAYNLNPKYYRIDNTWDILELDFIEGNLLELNSDKRNFNLKIFYEIITGLFILSLKGIKYKQFRGRHIIKNDANRIKFIDFGQSEISNILEAFLYNFKILNFNKRKIKPGKLLYLLYFHYFKKRKKVDLLSNAKDRFLKNKDRVIYATPDYLKKKPGDLVASKHLKEMESNLKKAVLKDKYIYLDILDIKFDYYGLSGHIDWGFIWHNILQTTSFKDKIIFEMFCCQAAVSSYSILEGAKKSFASDNNKYLIDAAQNLAKALRINKINYIIENDILQLNKLIIKSSPDVLFACSRRLDNISNDRLFDCFANVAEIFWDTEIKNIDYKKLKKIGFSTIKYIAKTGSSRKLVYLSRENLT